MVKQAVIDIETKTPEPASVSAEQTGLAAIVERLALHPDVDVLKLEKVIELQERILRSAGETAFNEAMSSAQREMRPISADAHNPQTRSRYASYAALDMALRPIYTRFDFAISYNTDDSPIADCVRVLAYVTRGGYTRTYHVDMPNDGKGAKGGDVMTRTHATGAAMSYGMRYLLKMIFNVAVGEDDRDGNRVESQQQGASKPDGYDDWLTDIEGCADNGWPELRDAFNRSKTEYRDHLVRTANAKWEALKKRAAEITRKAKTQEPGR